MDNMPSNLYDLPQTIHHNHLMSPVPQIHVDTSITHNMPYPSVTPSSSSHISPRTPYDISSGTTDDYSFSPPTPFLSPDRTRYPTNIASASHSPTSSPLMHSPDGYQMKSEVSAHTNNVDGCCLTLRPGTFSEVLVGALLEHSSVSRAFCLQSRSSTP